MFLGKFLENTTSSFFWHNVLVEGGFVTQLSTNAGISVLRIVCYNKLLLQELFFSSPKGPGRFWGRAQSLTYKLSTASLSPGINAAAA